MESVPPHRRPPRLRLLETSAFHEAGVPRALVSSIDGRIVCVGLKDGRVLAFPSRPPRDFRPRSAPSPVRSPPIRSLCDVTQAGAHKQSWLVGRVGGQVDWLEVSTDSEAPEVRFRGNAIEGDANYPDDHTSYIGRLDDDHVIISHGTPRPYADGSYCEIRRIIGEKLSDPVRLKAAGNLRTVVPLRLPDEPLNATARAWLLISYAAELWIVERNADGTISDVTTPVDPWPRSRPNDDGQQEGFRPALVMDTARLAAQPASAHVVLSTDLGLYSLTYRGGADIAAAPIHCIGPSGVTLAVTAGRAADHVYLWVADGSGTNHLLHMDRSAHDDTVTWHRIHFGHNSSAAIQAIALQPERAQRELEPGSKRCRFCSDEIIVWQTRRDESIAVTTYGAVSCPEHASEPTRLADVVRFEQIGPFLARLYQEYDVAALLPWTQRPATRTATVAEVQKQVADLFDLLPDHGQQLRDFLSDPKPDLAINALRVLCSATEHMSDPEVNAAVDDTIHLWNHTLVGALLRCGLTGDDELALGIIRWHQRVYRVVSPAGTAAEIPVFPERFGRAVIQAVKTALFDARRWTVFAPLGVSGDGAFYMPNVARQIREHGDDLPQRIPTQDAPLTALEDRLIKECMLFKHRSDDEERIALGDQVQGLVFDLHCVQGPRSVSGAEPAARVESWVAGLWRKSTILLFRVEQSADGNAALERVRTIAIPAQAAPPPPHGQVLEDVRFGRAIGFWAGDEPDAHWLLASVRCTFSDEEREQLVLYAVALEPEVGASTEPRPPEALTGDADIGDATVLAMHAVDPGVFALGMRCASEPGDAPNLALVEVDVRARSLRRRATLRLPSAYGTVHNLSASPVTCLAVLTVPETTLPSAPCSEVVIAGMDDGQIYLVPLLRDRDGARGFGVPMLIGRLSAPVWRLAARAVENEKELPRLRVFAGVADGHVVAFESQRVEVKSADGREARITTRFATLWATRDQGPIVGLWCFHTDLRAAKRGEREQHKAKAKASKDGASGARQPAVLAVTRDGRALLFADNDKVRPGSHRELSPERQRLPGVPGQRIDRFVLRSNAFAAVRVGPPDATPGAPISRLLVVTGDSSVRLLALHLPKRSEVRRARYEKIWDTYFLRVCGQAGRIDGPMLRYAEALRRLAPELWLIAIPSFLRRDRQRALFKVEADWYPLYLRPFREAAERYKLLQEALEAPEFDANAGVTSEAIAELERKLELSLGIARRLGNRALFKEMIETVLRRFNYTLMSAARKPGPARHAALYEVYSRILGVVDRACVGWLGSDTESYSRVQIVRAKNLVDGDALSQLATALDELNTQRSDAIASRTIERIVGLRVDSVSLLLSDGAPLLSLETLRATNLSLLRAAWFMHSDGERANRARPWPRIDRFLTLLGNFASQASHTADDALAHEIVRAYAVCLFIAPHEATRVAISACTAAMPAAIEQRIERQVELVATLLGTGAPRASVEAYTRALREPPLQLPAAPAANAALDSGERRLYRAELAWFRAFAPYRTVLAWLRHTAEKLETSPGTTSFSAVGELLARVMIGWKVRRTPVRVTKPARVVPKRRTLLAHKLIALPASAEHLQHYALDRGFWQQRLHALAELCANSGLAQVETDIDRRSVPPAYVLQSTEIARWCEQTASHPDFHKLQQPQRGAYERALQRLRAVASQLRTSTAVQQQLVTGVLGHNLLEALDEHVLQLTEQAHVLHPVELYGIRTRSGPAEVQDTGTPAAGLDGFAQALHAQARQARTIPKNLRTLYQLVNPAESSDENLEAYDSISELVSNAFRAERFEIAIEIRDTPRVDATAARLLRMVLAELVSNHRVHGHHRGPKPRATWEDDGLVVRVPVSTGKDPVSLEKQERLAKLADSRMQRFLPRAPYEEESSGMGLYLGNLAAAAVGWELSLSYTKGDETAAFILRKAVRA